MIEREADGWYVIFAVEGPRKVIAPAVGDEAFECQTAATRLSFRRGAKASYQALPSVVNRRQVLSSCSHISSCWGAPVEKSLL